MSLFLLLPTSTSPSGNLPADDIGMNDTNADVTCYSGVSVNSDGNVYWIGTTGPGNINLTDEDKGSYIDGGSTSDFWVRCTVNSGTLDAGSDSTGVWLACTTTRNWYVRDTSQDDVAVTADIDVELALDSSGSLIEDTANYTPSANWVTI